MLNTFYGIKQKQTQTFTQEGKRIPVTEVSVMPCTVTQIKTADKDGYWAVQLGFGHRTAKSIRKPIAGHLKKTGLGNFQPRFLREVRLNKTDVEKNSDLPLQIGNQIKVAQVLKIGDTVKVTGISKGKGFAGVVKRHGFAGGPRTHGQSDRERAPGSIGQTTTPGRVYKGKRMAGRKGQDRVTISGLKIINIDEEKNLVTVMGLVPGRINTPVMIEKNHLTV